MEDVNSDKEEIEESESSEEEDILREKFFQDNKDKLIPFPKANDKTKEDRLSDYLWDDWDIMNRNFKGLEIGREIYLCTVVTDDDSAWILDGYRVINRLGYFVSKTPFIIDKEKDIRYW